MANIPIRHVMNFEAAQGRKPKVKADNLYSRKGSFLQTLGTEKKKISSTISGASTIAGYLRGRDESKAD